MPRFPAETDGHIQRYMCIYERTKAWWWSFVYDLCGGSRMREEKLQNEALLRHIWHNGSIANWQCLILSRGDGRRATSPTWPLALYTQSTNERESELFLCCSLYAQTKHRPSHWLSRSSPPIVVSFLFLRLSRSRCWAIVQPPNIKPAILFFVVCCLSYSFIVGSVVPVFLSLFYFMFSSRLVSR
jgi:hypothetical protein